MGVIGVVATLKIQEGKNAEFEEIFLGLREQVKANEEGCLQYDLMKSKKDETTYVVMEQYASQEALEAHGKTDYFRASGAKLGAVMGGAPEIVYLDQV